MKLVKRSLISALIFCAAGLYLVRDAAAHDLVILPETGSLTLKFGHPGEYVAPEHDKLLRLNAYLDTTSAPISLLSGVSRFCATFPKITFGPYPRGRRPIVRISVYFRGAGQGRQALTYRWDNFEG